MNKFDSPDQAKNIANLALGRIFKLMDRSFVNGDIETYEDAKSVFLDAMDYLERFEQVYIDHTRKSYLDRVLAH